MVVIGLKLERMYLRRYILSFGFVKIYATWKVAVTLGPLTEGAVIRRPCNGWANDWGSFYDRDVAG